MTALRKHDISEDSGQALVELAMSVSLLLILALGAIDTARAIYYVQVIKNLTGEGSSMASRGTSLSQTAQTVINDAGTNISLSAQGCVIVTAILSKGTGGSPPFQVSGQSTQGSCTGISSKIGCYPHQEHAGRPLFQPKPPPHSRSVKHFT